MDQNGNIGEPFRPFSNRDVVVMVKHSRSLSSQIKLNAKVRDLELKFLCFVMRSPGVEGPFVEWPYVPIVPSIRCSQ